MPAKRSNLVKPFLQVAFLSLGLLCALSRIFDYWHHWGDVLVGMFLGAIVAFFIVSFWSDILRMDHYFFEVGVGQFPKKFMHNKNCWKKFMQGEPWWKKLSKCFLLSWYCIMWCSKIVTQSIPTKKYHTQPKGEEKNFLPQKIALNPPPSKK